MKPIYCVTARNRLTGQREVVTPPCSKTNAETCKLKLTLASSKEKAYIYPKVEVYQKAMEFSKKRV